MDDLVRQALLKWPNVPDCYGWLGLDARGHWYLRDMQTQALGAFVQSKGQRVEHDRLMAFIHRNYACDERGCWFFQNGPQRVYVELENTPWILRVTDDACVHTQAGVLVEATQSLVDEAGKVYLVTAQGLGLVHSLDVPSMAHLLEMGRWPLVEVHEALLASQFGFVRSPMALARDAGLSV